MAEQGLLFRSSEKCIDPASNVSVFRSIHYLGSKLRIVDPLCQIILSAEAGNGPICDLFAGTGIVSAALSRTREVIAVDIQEYSRQVCSALLIATQPTQAEAAQLLATVRQSPLRQALSRALEPLLVFEEAAFKGAALDHPDELLDILEHGSIVSSQLSSPPNDKLGRAIKDTLRRLREASLDSSVDSTVTRYFGGVYYSFRQAIELDCILAAVHSPRFAGNQRYLAAALGTASDAVNTVGRQFAQPIRPRYSNGKPKNHVIAKIWTDRRKQVTDIFEQWVDRYLNFEQPKKSCAVRRMDFRDALADPQIECDVVYADPPYTRDHYSRYYHALETMCLRDNPAISTVNTRGTAQPSRGLYRVNRHQSPFCIKSQAPQAFHALFRGTRSKGASLVLSYSPFSVADGERPRVAAIDSIYEIGKSYFRSVEITSPGKFSHSKLTSSEMTVDSRSDAEKVLVCRN